MTKSLTIRVREVNSRPQKIQELKDVLNATEHFVRTTRALFSKKEEDEKPFTDGDLDSLDKIITETYVRFSLTNDNNRLTFLNFL